MFGCSMCGTQVTLMLTLGKTGYVKHSYPFNLSSISLEIFLFRKGHLPSNGVPLASLCLHRSRNSSEGNVSKTEGFFFSFSDPSLCSGQCKSTSCTSTSKIFLFTSTFADPLQLIGEIIAQRFMEKNSPETFFYPDFFLPSNKYFYLENKIPLSILSSSLVILME